MKKYLRKAIWKIIDFVSSHSLYKVASILLATILWYLVQGEETLEVSRRLEIALEIPAGYGIRDSKIPAKEVNLRGTRTLLADLSARSLQAVIKVPAGKTGPMRFRIDQSFVPRWDNRVKMVVHDPIVDLFVEEIITKTIPIKIATTGRPKEGWSLINIRIEPKEVVVSGLKSSLQKIFFVGTELIDLSTFSESKKLEVDLIRPSHLDADLEKTKTTLFVTTMEERTVRQLRLPIQAFGMDKPDIPIRPKSITIAVEGPIHLFANTPLDEFRAWVNLEAAKRSQSPQVPIEVKMPDGFKIIHQSHKVVWLQ